MHNTFKKYLTWLTPRKWNRIKPCPSGNPEHVITVWIAASLFFKLFEFDLDWKLDVVFKTEYCEVINFFSKEELTLTQTKIRLDCVYGNTNLPYPTTKE